jgi:hypothetical protein
MYPQEYTQNELNAAIKAHTDLDIFAKWDGDDETADFRIFVDDEITPLTVDASRASIELQYNEPGSRMYVTTFYDRDIAKVGEEIARVVGEAL